MSGIRFRSPEEREEQLRKARSTPPLAENGTAIFDRLRWLWDFVVTARDPRVPIERAAEMLMERAKPLHRYWWPYDGVWSYRPEERLPLVRQPVLVLQPHEALLEYSRAAARLFPDARFVDLPGLSRDVFERDVGARDFCEAMRAFLT